MTDIYVDNMPSSINELMNMLENGQYPNIIKIVPSSKNGKMLVIQAVNGGYQLEKYEFILVW